MFEKRPTVIVYPHDESRPASAGYAWAADLSERLDAELRLVQFMRGRIETAGVVGDDGASSDREVRVFAGRRDPAGRLEAYAREVGASLIVIDADYGGRGFWRAAGSTARSLGGRAACPVLVVPSRAKHPEWLSGAGRPVLCAVDFSAASLNAVPVAAALASESGSPLHLLHVIEGFPGRSVLTGTEAMRTLREFEGLVEMQRRRLRQLLPAGARRPGDLDTTVESGTAHRRIVERAAAIDAGAIVMGAAPRGVMHAVLERATIGRVLRRAASPVLLVPAGVSTAQALMFTQRAPWSTVPSWQPIPETAPTPPTTPGNRPSSQGDRSTTPPQPAMA